MKYTNFFILLFFYSTIFSQVNGEETPYIEVIGKAETEIIPNEIYLNICIRERLEKGKKLTIQFLENELKEELTKIGIPSKNLSISDVNAILAKTGLWKEEILSIANYTLEVNGSDKLKKLFESFKKLKISEVIITKATHSDIIVLRKNNRIKAIKIAKDKSDYLLSAIGEQTGKPIIINEIQNNNHNNFALANHINSNSSYSISKVKSYSNNIVQFEKIKITSTIYVKFKIK